MSDLEIIFQDEHLVVINKPANLLTHRSLIDKRETLFALQLLRDQLNQYVYPIHRLDKPTSGILVFALTPDLARILSQQMQQQQIKKHYLAIVRGFCDDHGVIDYALKEVLDKMTDARAKSDKPAQMAITHYRSLAQTELPYTVGKYNSARYSLLKLSPETGRKHQLRRHMKHIHHPIIGDTRYGRGEHNRFFRNQFNCHRLLLHAYELHMQHPLENKSIVLRAKMDEVFLSVIEAMGWIGSPELTSSGCTIMPG